MSKDKTPHIPKPEVRKGRDTFEGSVKGNTQPTYQAPPPPPPKKPK